MTKNNENTTVKPMTFYDKVIAIDNSRAYHGVLGKMDKVLKLAKQGYKKDEIAAGLTYVARRIKNRQMRDTALDVYLSRVY